MGTNTLGSITRVIAAKYLVYLKDLCLNNMYKMLIMTETSTKNISRRKKPYCT